MINYAKAIALLADCGDLRSATEMEHAAIDSLLFVLNKALRAGASFRVVVEIVDLIDEFYSAHIRHEEECLQKHGVPIVEHAASHRALLDELHRVRGCLVRGDSVAGLEVVDLLNRLRHHAETFDKPAAASIEKAFSHPLRCTSADYL